MNTSTVPSSRTALTAPASLASSVSTTVRSSMISGALSAPPEAPTLRFSAATFSASELTSDTNWPTSASLRANWFCNCSLT